MGEILDFENRLLRLARPPQVQGQLRLGLAVVVPTLNERDNILPLLAALDRALAGQRYEIVVVDDWSIDGTADLVGFVAQSQPGVRLIRRFGRRGLSSAVIEGMLSTTMELVAVIDADMQHDEAILPRLCALVEGGEADLAIGSRYMDGGSTGDWAGHRRWASRAATRLATLALPNTVSDPMSGFFVMRRSVLDAIVPQLACQGFKLLVDILMSAPEGLKVRELPYTFRPRTMGESKLGYGVMADYATLLVRKAIQHSTVARLIAFGAVGTLGVGIHLGVLRMMLEAARLPFPRAQAVAVSVAILCNFLLNNRLTFADRALHGVRMLKGLASFYLTCGIGAVANVGVGSLLYADDQRWWVAGVAGAIVGSIWNFATASYLTWRRR